MKKSLFFAAAASALMLTACSSENDVVQSPTNQNTVAVQQQAVGFDIYTSSATNARRAGYEGVMTTPKLKEATAGFGVFAYYQDGVNYASSLKPDFMYDQKVTWAGGWTYDPLKYWPNETTKDSQDPAATATSAKPLDKISFFAYAPYVDYSGLSATEGITGFTANNVTGDPKVTFAINTDPDHNVDLLWGVAPAGFEYTNVSGSSTTVGFGLPLKDLVKPDKDQKVKFLFQHALSRIGLSVVSAIDQIAAGDDAGTFSKDPTTKVLIKEVSITAPFGTGGQLNLNNDVENKAKWNVTTTDLGTSALFTINTTNKFLAPDLRYDATTISGITAATPTKTFADLNIGVLPSEQTLLAGDKDESKEATDPTFAYNKVYYTSAGVGDKGYVVAKTTATADADIFTKDEKGNYIYAFADGATVTLNGYSPEYYKLTLSTPVAAEGALAAGDYYVKTGTGSDVKYTLTTLASDGTADAADKWYPKTGFSDAAQFEGTPYTTGTYYTGLIPRYFMVIPTGAAIDISVNIKYAVVTNDAKLDGTISNVENDITKTVSVDLKNGKSYNLKLILGLTSVKLDATVADWKIADDTEIWLPQNNE